jgi:WD40 repeat protein
LILLWQTATGRLVRTLEGHATNVYSVAWSPVAETLASAGQDGTIRLWDPATGQLIRTLDIGDFKVEQIAWSPDGNTVASASDDGIIHLWPGTAARLLNLARDRIRLYTPTSAECQRYFDSPSCPPAR